MAETPQRRSTDRSFPHVLWMACKRSPVIAILLVVALLELVTLTLGLTVLYPRARENQQRLEALAESNSVLIRENAHASLEQCRRGNVSRPQQVRVYEAISEGNKRRAYGEFKSVKAWKATAAAFPTTADVAALHVEVAQTKRRAALDEAEVLHRAAVTIVGAQREVAKYPGAKSLAKRSIVDCEGQFG